MIVKNRNNEIVVRISPEYDTSRIQEILDYLRYVELTSKSDVNQKDVDILIEKVKKGRWERVKKKLDVND